MTVIIRYKIDEQEHILMAQVFATDADGMREYMVTEDTLDELRSEWAAAIRKQVSETGQLTGEVEVG
jgi:hypothetical protein